MNGLGDRAENHAELLELILLGGGDRHAVEHRVHGDAGQTVAFVQRNAEAFEGLGHFRVDLRRVGGIAFGG